MYARDGRALGELLDEELGKALGMPVVLGMERVSEKVET